MSYVDHRSLRKRHKSPKDGQKNSPPPPLEYYILDLDYYAYYAYYVCVPRRIDEQGAKAIL
jgi:hypothetical protein